MERLGGDTQRRIIQLMKRASVFNDKYIADEIIAEVLSSKEFEEAASAWARKHGWKEPE